MAIKLQPQHDFNLLFKHRKRSRALEDCHHCLANWRTPNLLYPCEPGFCVSLGWVSFSIPTAFVEVTKQPGRHALSPGQKGTLEGTSASLVLSGKARPVLSPHPGRSCRPRQAEGHRQRLETHVTSGLGGAVALLAGWGKTGHTACAPKDVPQAA